MDIKFKNFEIRRPTYATGAIPKGRENDWDIVKWDDRHESCFSVAFLHCDKDGEYDCQTVGMRLFEHWEPGLDTFIQCFVDFQQALRRIERCYNDD